MDSVQEVKARTGFGDGSLWPSVKQRYDARTGGAPGPVQTRAAQGEDANPSPAKKSKFTKL